MKLVYRLRRMSDLKKNLLDADLRHTQLILMDELHQTLEKLKRNRGLQAKIVNVLRRVSSISYLTIQMFQDNLEAMKVKDIQIMKYRMYDELGGLTLSMEVDDAYFNLAAIQGVPLIGKHLKNLADGKKGFKRRIEKSIKQNYTKDFEIIREK